MTGSQGEERVIEVRDLVFEYPAKRALHNLTFSIGRRSVTALVGPNGAGKTTLLRCLAALETPYSGAIRMAGVDVITDPRRCHRHTGYLPDSYGLYDELTVRQCLKHMAAIHEVPKAATDKCIEEVLRDVEMSSYIDSRVDTLSRGWRQRLAIAQAIIHKPKILLLDEPAAGLDPEARHSLSRLILNLQARGITQIISSHILAELEDYSSDMMIIRDGQIIKHHPIASVRASPQRKLALRLLEVSAETGEFLKSFPGISTVISDGNSYTFSLEGDDAKQHELLKQLLTQNFPVVSLVESGQSMEELYLSRIRAGKS